jgi:predicted ATPase/class 3 adenylate cyclase/Tfp pilus assembly protein PilF
MTSDAGTAPDLPQGTVTLLFTDIEGSTQLVQRLGDGYQQALAEHQTLIRELVAKWGGQEVDSQGDALFAAFPRASDALNMAVEGQKAMSAHAWPDGEVLRVRIALHTGEPRISSSDYVGIDVHRASRLCSAGHGGQVLLSQTTRDLVRDNLPAGAVLRDMGVHRLKDLQRPEPVFQLVIAGLPGDFPPLKTLDGHRNNLPTQPTLLIGRDKELAAAREILSRPEVQIVTLTGAGGSGKTRLAIQIAAELVAGFPDGVHFCPLASISDPGLVILTVAQMVDADQQAGSSIMEALEDALSARRVLLVLDNFEQVAGAAPLLAELVARCPGVKVLVTSRERLHLRGEYEFPVQPLPLPDLEDLPHPKDLTEYPAVQLFIQRALAVKPDFVPDAEDAVAIAEICARLDGLPLAIELGAARTRLLPPKALLARLGHRLAVLTSGARDLPARQQTLRKTIDWSYDLLNESERTLFNRLAVFGGGCSLEAAEAVCAGNELSEAGLLEVMGSLVDKNLLRQESLGDDPRFGQLETLREYGLERLEESGTLTRTRRLHAAFFLALAEEADPLLEGPAQALWIERLDQEYGNLRAALQWLADGGEVEQALRLGAALWRYWEIRGYLSEGRAWLAQLLSLPQQSVRKSARARALYAAGVLADAQCDYAAAREQLEEYLAINREVGDPSSSAAALINLGNVTDAQGDLVIAHSLYTEALEIFRTIGDPLGQAWSLQSLANVAQQQSDYPGARSMYEQALEIWEEDGNSAAVAVGLNDVGSVLDAMGDHAGARSAFERSLALFQELNNEGAAAITLNNLGKVNSALGDDVAARRLYEQGLRIVAALGDMRGTARLLESLANLAAKQGRPERALRLAGAAATLREDIGAPLAGVESATIQDTLDLARRLMSRAGADADAIWMAGRSLSPEEAMELAQQEDDDGL